MKIIKQNNNKLLKDFGMTLKEDQFKEIQFKTNQYQIFQKIVINLSN